MIFPSFRLVFWAVTDGILRNALDSTRMFNFSPRKLSAVWLAFQEYHIVCHSKSLFYRSAVRCCEWNKSSLITREEVRSQCGHRMPAVKLSLRVQAARHKENTPPAAIPSSVLEWICSATSKCEIPSSVRTSFIRSIDVLPLVVTRLQKHLTHPWLRLCIHREWFWKKKLFLFFFWLPLFFFFIWPLRIWNVFFGGVVFVGVQVSLYDFVLGVLNYCVDSKENLSRLAFDIYDRHTTGTITEADLEGMLIDVWGVKWWVYDNSMSNFTCGDASWHVTKGSACRSINTFSSTCGGWSSEWVYNILIVSFFFWWHNTRNITKGWVFRKLNIFFRGRVGGEVESLPGSFSSWNLGVVYHQTSRINAVTVEAAPSPA